MSDDTPKPTILLVEDTLTQAMLMQHQLKKAGYTVKLARSGKAALDEMEKDSYGLILSDINMPGMDGFQLCKELKANDKFKSIPFVLLATPVEKGEILKMLESGADSFILKAYDEATFIGKLNEIVATMELRKGGDQSAAFYAGQEHKLPAVNAATMDFLLSAFEMYLFQHQKSSTHAAEPAS